MIININIPLKLRKAFKIKNTDIIITAVEDWLVNATEIRDNTNKFLAFFFNNSSLDSLITMILYKKQKQENKPNAVGSENNPTVPRTPELSNLALLNIVKISE
jgi:hypothetical protein